MARLCFLSTYWTRHYRGSSNMWQKPRISLDSESYYSLDIFVSINRSENECQLQRRNYWLSKFNVINLALGGHLVEWAKIIFTFAISPLDYYQQVIMMSGSDLSKFGYIHPFWNPKEYASQFARLLNCPPDDTYLMMICLRDNRTLSWQLMLEAQERVKPNVSLEKSIRNLCSLLYMFKVAMCHRQ